MNQLVNCRMQENLQQPIKYDMLTLIGGNKMDEFQKIIKSVLDLMDEGIHVVDAKGISIVYNQAMASIEKTNPDEVLGKPFREVFYQISSGDSTLLKALSQGGATIKKQQTYQNQAGKEITTINTTLPITEEGQIVAAVEISKNITSIKEMSHVILDLHREKLNPQKVQEHKIRKYNFDNLLSQSSEFLETISMSKKAAKSIASVLIYGETGTGKELIAQSIHYDSPRRDKPFIAQNCAALPESLLEGILFGTAKGGFTGAVDRPGLFEQANGGTLLLDEISAMPYELQGKLLRVLQEDYLRRVGGTKDVPLDVRIVATINERADELMKKGMLRKDLYYRLSIIRINLPPLRERRGDILYLAESFLKKHCSKNNISELKLSSDAKEKLLSHSYPGNVRELENIIVSAVSMTDGSKLITGEHILISEDEKHAYSPSFDYTNLPLDKHLEEIEKGIIEETLSANGNNISKTAEQLGIKRQTLQHKLKKYQLLRE